MTPARCLALACVFLAVAGCGGTPPVATPDEAPEAVVPSRERPEIRVALASSTGFPDVARARIVCDAVLESSPNQEARRQLADADPDALCAEILVVAAKGELGPPDELIPLALALAPWNPRARLAEVDLVEAFVLDTVGLQRRLASWCLADRYARLAASVTDSTVQTLAAEKAERYGAVRLDDLYISDGPKPGQTITVELGTYGTCRTPAR